MGASTSSSQTVTFDLSTQSGVMQALYAVRTSDLPTADKNALRDQIFTYTKSGGDTRMRDQIVAKLNELSLSQAFLDVYRAKAKTPAKPGFSGGRRAPSFSVPKPPAAIESAASAESAPAPASAPTDTEPSTTVAPAPEPSTPEPAPEALATTETSAAPTPTKPAPAAEPTPTQPAEPAPAPVNEPEPEPASATPSRSVPNDVPAAPATPDSEPTGAANADAYSIERIREIKRYINNKIGNPVNLVDIDNELGRSYMAALLAAMQSVNAETGRAGASEMQELERIFRQVQPLLQEDGTAAAPSAVTDTPPTPSAPAPTTPEPQPQSAPTANPVSADAPPQPEPEPEQPVPVNEPPVSPVTPVSGMAPESSSRPADRGSIAPTPPTPAPPAPAPEPQPQPTPVPTPPPQPEPHTPMPAVNAVGEEADEDVAAVPMPTESARPPKPARPPLGIGEVPAKSVPRNDAPSNLPGATDASAAAPASRFSVGQEADHSLANQLSELDKKAAAANEHHGDPLHAPEVDAGLEQLLQEWNLFKSSGLFGTGPNGREHPLFKKLAPMMIQDVAQGRFADARPEVTQSITDYMNGWRYEQGIVYEPGESFETYLRRVIRFIIDSKK